MKGFCIEIDGPLNESLSFRPLPGRAPVRGRFDMRRIESADNTARAKWPLPIPGQLIGVDAEGNGFIREPLHEEKHSAIRETIEQRGYKLPPPCETFTNVDPGTWSYWCGQAVACGLARVVEGTIPDVDESVVKRDFIFAPRKPSSNDRLADVLERLLEKLG